MTPASVLSRASSYSRQEVEAAGENDFQQEWESCIGYVLLNSSARISDRGLNNIWMCSIPSDAMDSRAFFKSSFPSVRLVSKSKSDATIHLDDTFFDPSETGLPVFRLLHPALMIDDEC